MAPWSSLDSPWICKRCSPTLTGWKPSGGLPVAWVPTTRTDLVSPSRGSIRATTYGFASWQSRLRRKTGPSTYHLKNPWLKAHAVAGCHEGGKRAYWHAVHVMSLRWSERHYARRP